MLRKQIEASASLKPSIGMQFSVNYQNNKKESEEVQPREGIDQGLLTSGHPSHLDFAFGIESVLKNSGVPVSQMSQLSSNMLSIDIASKEGFRVTDLSCEICAAKSLVISYSSIRTLLILYLTANLRYLKTTQQKRQTKGPKMKA